MRITVSGLPGSGTTSLSRYLAENTGYTMISAGEVFRQLRELGPRSVKSDRKAPSLPL